MFFSLLTAPLTAILGYLYPAYITYKAVEKRQPNIDELLFWGKYWIVIGTLSAIESLSLGLLVWVPFYTTARLILMVYLWHPRTQGVLLLYHRAVQPVVMRHEDRIDKGLQELHTRGADLAVEGARKAASAVQSALQQGQGLVKNQYNSFTKRGGAPYAAPAAAYSQQAADVAAKVVGGGPDSLYDLKARKGF